ncbi:MAG: ATP-dependent DNA helicase RecG [Candidatus Moranbacteria bacterium]|nr:ATP-dependent DNA helicase RecG [Candidatus Moranbacteria bacterium]
MRKPDEKLTSVLRLNPRQEKALKKLCLVTIQDLLLHFPFRYDDFSNIVTISKDYLGQIITVEGTVSKIKSRRIFPRRMTITEIFIQDSEDNTLRSVWFNQALSLSGIKEGMTIRVSGKLAIDQKFFSMSNPSFERAGRAATNTGCLVPVYPETDGITSKWIRWQMKNILGYAQYLEDFVPEETRKRLHLFSFKSALKQIHFPDDNEKLMIAQKTFAFREMFLIQIKALQTKMAWDGKKAISMKHAKQLTDNFIAKLPFTLTGAQEKAYHEILKDLEKPSPMNRLLNGDVGAGKTVVAAIAALQAAAAGQQVAIMAPTEVLARQHFESFCRIFADRDFSIALLTNSYKLLSKKPAGNISDSCIEKLPRSDLLEKISSGEIDIIIGTHALIQKDVSFGKLALVIIDEQHRFGVAQRSALQDETMGLKDGSRKTIPHLLTMTATPIPRTLAIAYFGSLELSILDEMPKNRKPITTRIAQPKQQREIYDFIRSEAGKRRQAFIIFPFVEESKSMTEVKAAITEHGRLAEEIFPELRLGLLHGKMKAKDKEEVMKKFKDKEYDILVSTSVVEVGIDIPNATVMLIENAERFGLSQLHQFRGRVGRGEHQSYCFLFTDSADPERLRVMEETTDGFRISERDLELRGPGQFFGRVQSGLPDIAMENLANMKLIRISREEAKGIVSEDPQLKKHPALRDAIRKFQEEVHME